MYALLPIADIIVGQWCWLRNRDTEASSPPNPQAPSNVCGGFRGVISCVILSFKYEFEFEGRCRNAPPLFLWEVGRGESALPPKADIRANRRDFRF
jgi:hypothetical protein